MTSPEDRPGEGAWRRIERLLPLPDELPQKALQSLDTELHGMPGPTQPTPHWITEGLERAIAARKLREARVDSDLPPTAS